MGKGDKWQMARFSVIMAGSKDYGKNYDAIDFGKPKKEKKNGRKRNCKTDKQV